MHYKLKDDRELRSLGRPLRWDDPEAAFGAGGRGKYKCKINEHRESSIEDR